TLLQWKDPDGNIKRRLMPVNAPVDLAVAQDFGKEGLLIMPGQEAAFRRYVAHAAVHPTTPRICTQRKLGFFELEYRGQKGVLAFMLPDRCLLPTSVADPNVQPQQPELVQFQPPIDSDIYKAYQSRGSLDQWQS